MGEEYPEWSAMDHYPEWSGMDHMVNYIGPADASELYTWLEDTIDEYARLHSGLTHTICLEATGRLLGRFAEKAKHQANHNLSDNR